MAESNTNKFTQITKMRTFSLLAAAAIIAAMASIEREHCSCLICEAADSTLSENPYDSVWYDSLAHLLIGELAERDVEEFAMDARESKPLRELYHDYAYDGLSTHYVDSLGDKIAIFTYIISK